MQPTILLIQDEADDNRSLTERLTMIGYRVLSASNFPPTAESIHGSGSILLNMPLAQLPRWIEKIRPLLASPVVWQCPAQILGGFTALDVDIDGMVCPSMTISELRLALELSSTHYRRRLTWAKEKEVLLKSLEERKWIEQAKGILSELKNIPEAEAYQFLRKQAMSERRKMTEVAKSIVTVYKLLQDSKRK